MVTIKNIVIVFSAYLIVSCIYRFYKAATCNVEMPNSPLGIRPAIPALLNLVAAILVGSGMFLGAPLFVAEGTLPYIYAFIGAILLTSIADAIIALKYSAAAELNLKKTISPVLAAVLGVVFLSYVLFLKSTPGNAADRLQLTYPVKGNWRVAAGGRSEMTNYHHDHPAAQNYAVDLVCAEGETEGRKVYAPIDGTIVEAIGNRSDDDTAPDGNIIIIGSGNGTQIALAHLMQGSVVMKKGDRVVRGQAIAACGQTGNAALPHLHIHAHNGEKPVPMVFQGRFLIANDRFTAE